MDSPSVWLKVEQNKFTVNHSLFNVCLNIVVNKVLFYNISTIVYGDFGFLLLAKIAFVAFNNRVNLITLWYSLMHSESFNELLLRWLLDL